MVNYVVVIDMDGMLVSIPVGITMRVKTMPHNDYHSFLRERFSALALGMGGKLERYYRDRTSN